MELDLEGTHAGRGYAMLASLITPRPIAWITSLSRDGRLNAAPFSFFNALGADTPIIGFCPGDRENGEPENSARNIRATRVRRQPGRRSGGRGDEQHRRLAPLRRQRTGKRLA